MSVMIETETSEAFGVRVGGRLHTYSNQQALLDAYLAQDGVVVSLWSALREAKWTLREQPQTGYIRTWVSLDDTDLAYLVEIHHTTRKTSSNYKILAAGRLAP